MSGIDETSVLVEPISNYILSIDENNPIVKQTCIEITERIRQPKFKSKVISNITSL